MTSTCSHQRSKCFHLDIQVSLVLMLLIEACEYCIFIVLLTVVTSSWHRFENGQDWTRLWLMATLSCRQLSKCRIIRAELFQVDVLIEHTNWLDAPSGTRVRPNRGVITFGFVLKSQCWINEVALIVSLLCDNYCKMLVLLSESKGKAVRRPFLECVFAHG